MASWGAAEATYATNPAAFSNGDDFSMVSAELLGGAPLPPMTPAQRQQYIDGITIKAKYVGSVEVPEPRGEQTAHTAITRVRAAHKANKENKQRVWLVMSTSGIKVLDFDYHTLRDSYALEHIAYVTTLPSNRRVFCFISANNTVRPPVYKCHVYKSNSRSLLIAQTMGRCFSLALEMLRSRQMQQHQQDHRQSYRGGHAPVRSVSMNRGMPPPAYAAPYGGPAPAYGSPSSAYGSMSPIRETGSVSYSPLSSSTRSDLAVGTGSGSGSFNAIVERIRARCAVFLPEEDMSVINSDLHQLRRLYEGAQDKLVDAERRVSNARMASVRSSASYR